MRTAVISAPNRVELRDAPLPDPGADLAAEPADAVREIRGGLPWRPDVVFDCVAVAATMAQACALASKGGTVVVVGVPRGRRPAAGLVTAEFPLAPTAEAFAAAASGAAVKVHVLPQA